MDLQNECASLAETLQHGYHESGVTIDKAAAVAGTTPDSVKNLLYGKTVAQNFFIVCSLFKLFGISVDQYIDNLDALPPPELPHDVMLSDQFLAALNRQADSHAREIEIYKQELAKADAQRTADRQAVVNSDLRHSHRETRQFIVIVLLLIVIVGVFLYDLFNPQTGFVRHILARLRSSVRNFIA